MIKQKLNLNKLFKYIGNLLNKNYTTISQEIRNHYKIKNSNRYDVFLITVFIEMNVK